MDLPERTHAFYADLRAGESRAWFSPRAEGEVDGKGQKVAAMARRFGEVEHRLHEVAVKRNLCFVHWESRLGEGLDILAWDQDGLLVQWSRQHASTE